MIHGFCQLLFLQLKRRLSVLEILLQLLDQGFLLLTVLIIFYFLCRISDLCLSPIEIRCKSLNFVYVVLLDVLAYDHRDKESYDDQTASISIHLFTYLYINYRFDVILNIFSQHLASIQSSSIYSRKEVALQIPINSIPGAQHTKNSQNLH